MPETIIVDIPMHCLTTDADDAPTCRTLPLGQNRSTGSMSTEYTVAPAILNSIMARGPRSSNWLIIIIVAPS
jgi:hypothetical protein